MGKIIFPLQIRKAEFTNALNIASIQIDTWKTTYIGKIEKEYLNKLDVHEKEIRWKNKIIADDGLIFIALIGEKVVGFISGGKSKEEKYGGEIFAFYIRDEFQGKGIGKILFLINSQYIQKSRILFFFSLGFRMKSSNEFLSKNVMKNWSSKKRNNRKTRNYGAAIYLENLKKE